VALSGQKLAIPTVLLLDLSGSVVKAGALEALKDAAETIVDSLLPEQTLALLTFADAVTVRVAFSADKSALKAAIADISGADGASTNLYGAVVQGLGMWKDGFNAQGGSASAQVTSGLAIVITDGADTAGVQTLEDVRRAQGNQRVVAIGVGEDINQEAMQAMGNAGEFYPSSYDDLQRQLGNITSAIRTLNKSIYQASYCSPKRAGEHELTFTVRGNEDSVRVNCKPAVFSSSGCKNDVETEVCSESGTTTTCCPAHAPYSCVKNNRCYQSPGEAASACGAECVRCGGTGQPDQAQALAGPAITVPFVAQGYQSGQCPQYDGPKCKALDACCVTLPRDLASMCTMSSSSALGNETKCATQVDFYCPTLDAECAALKTCCADWGASYRANCYSTFSGTGSAPDEIECMAATMTYCLPKLGRDCKALKACCASLADDAGGATGRRQCDAALVSSVTQGATAETTCVDSTDTYCPSPAGEP